MEKEERKIWYDEYLKLEAYYFEGVEKPFPKHFHDYYVIGFLERGRRRLVCGIREYEIGRGDIVVFNPGDSHGCVQSGESMDYKALNIPKSVMLSVTEEITGDKAPVEFSENVIKNDELLFCLEAFHSLIVKGGSELEREEAFMQLVSLLAEKYGRHFSVEICEAGEEIKRACDYMDEHYGEKITLKKLCEISGLSKSALLRAFTKHRGVTPYRYLQAVRIGRARELLEKGETPTETALETGFSDQSHFTNSFSAFTGLSPAAYGKIFKENTNEK